MKNLIGSSLNLLGTPHRDKMTGFAGVVSSIAFDAYGCVGAFLVPPAAEKNSKYVEGNWFDVKRLVATGKRVMPEPNFGQLVVGAERGGIEKPALPSGPR